MATTITAGNVTSGAALASDSTGTLELKTGTGSGTTAISIGASQAVSIPGTLNVTGAVTLSTTLGVAQGGTGQTTYTDGQLLIGNSTGNTLTKATLTAGSGISITNGSGSITIASSGAVTSVSAGAGMSFTTITGTGSVDMGTPSTLTNTTTNSASGTTHTHALTGELVETTAGSALYYGARAWVNFEGTSASSPLTIRSSANVSSVTRSSTGIYTMNFATSMNDANYAAVIGSNNSSSADPPVTAQPVVASINTTRATSNCTLKSVTQTGSFNLANFSVAIFS